MYYHHSYFVILCHLGKFLKTFCVRYSMFLFMSCFVYILLQCKLFEVRKKKSFESFPPPPLDDINGSFSPKGAMCTVFRLMFKRSLSFYMFLSHIIHYPSIVATVEPRYNEVLGTMKITLLYQGPVA